MDNVNSLQVSNPKDEKISAVTTVVVLAIVFLLMFILHFQIKQEPIADQVVETQTYLDEIILQPSSESGGGSSSSSDASPSQVEGQVLTEGERSTTVTQEGKPNGTDTGDNPFGTNGSGGRGTGGFGNDEGTLDNGKGDGTTCDNNPTNLNTIINLLKNNIPVKKPTSANVTISIRPDGTVSAVKVTGLGASEADISSQIKSIVAQTKCLPCNGKNKNSRSFTFAPIKLVQD
jgi:hypothetical protein